jgi:hypothetical protein
MNDNDKNGAPYLGSITKNSSNPAERQIQRYYLQNLARQLLPDLRVASCFRRILPGHGMVSIMVEKDARRAYYRGLVVCGAIWQCPVCAAKITESRRHELSQCLDFISARCCLVTFTLRHTMEDSLKSLGDGIKQAYQSSFSGRWNRDFREEWGVVGSVRSLEVTYGENGWHPHYHVLLFVDPAWAVEDLEGEMLDQIRRRWITMLHKKSYDASWERGVTCKVAYSSIVEYVAKYGHEPADEMGWNITHEIAKGPAKLGRKGGKTPFGLLLDFGSGDIRAGELYVEYVAAFSRHHQLEWSSGLRRMVGLEDTEPTEQDLAEIVPDSAVLLCSLSPLQWASIVRHERRGQLLEVASRGDLAAVQNWLLSVGIRPASLDD